MQINGREIVDDMEIFEQNTKQDNKQKITLANTKSSTLGAISGNAYESVNRDAPLHVLHVFGRLNRGGAESRVMDLYRNMDRSKVQFDFMQHTEKVCDFQSEIEQLGGKVYHVPPFRFWNYASYVKAWRQFFVEHPEIKIVHGHMTSTASIYLPIARKRGIFTIAHSRNAGVDRGIKGTLTKLLRRNLKDRCDQLFACSNLAGEAVFGKKAMEQGRVTIIPNAIDAERFIFDPEIRRKKREELHIQPEEFLIGEVARFDPQKNQKYAVEILAACREKNFLAKLILIGEGPLIETVQQQVNDLGLQDYVIFTGLQKNVVPFYQAMDFFLLPSFYEGLPGVAVEAQASGLRGILSDAVTTETAMTDLMEFRSVQEPASKWADRIMACGHYERQNTLEQLQKAGFDVKSLAKKLQAFYLRVSDGNAD